MLSVPRAMLALCRKSKEGCCFVEVGLVGAGIREDRGRQNDRGLHS